MKQNLLKHALLVTVLLLGLITTFKKAAFAPPPVKVIALTTCCEGPYYRGTSNDCDPGEGNCVDHNCLPNETEHDGAVICP